MTTGGPLFSILYPSARPEKVREIYHEWVSKAVWPQRHEFILAWDARWFGLVDRVPLHYATEVQSFRLVENTRPYQFSGYVSAVNLAAEQATGEILIVIADDQYPCYSWDELILDRVFRHFSVRNQFAQTHLLSDLAKVPWVVDVSTGTPKEHERGIMVAPVLSRGRYQQLGYVFHPDYESMFADNEFCEHARLDECVIEAHDVILPHRHVMCENGEWKHGVKPEDLDAAYKAQMQQGAFELGKRVLDLHRRRQFKPFEAGRRSIAVCLSGETFSGRWVDGLLTLYTHLADVLGLNVIRLRNQISYTSNVYATREEIRLALLECDPRPDLVLWLDDDNLCDPDHFDRLLADLDGRPDLDGVTAWCWIHDEQKYRFTPSCGVFAADGVHWKPFDPSFAKKTDLVPVEATGFPCFLMRISAIEKAGERPFVRGILDDRLRHGIGGEDFAFMRAAIEGGAQFAVDPRVRVPHLKLVEVNPVFVDEGRAEQKIAVMLRVKNECRWIDRVIRAVVELGPVYVLDDDSTDNTRELARAAGAIVITSPFRGEGFNEARDKNYLVEFLVADHKAAHGCDPDWILCIDGDEEIEPAGAEKIRRACESGHADLYALRFVHLWDRPDQARIDRWYGTQPRFSLFRYLPGRKFISYYEQLGDGQGKGAAIHGLHCANAPLGGEGKLTAAPLDVSILHYGYMVKADRIRKYHWYNELDPNNETEDCYRHMVQGDIPEVPADAVLKHAGPREIRRLPRSLARPMFGWIDERELVKQ